MKRIKIYALLALILVFWKVFDTLKAAGYFIEITPSQNLSEEIIKTPPGIEDITIDSETSFAYLSSQDRRNREKTGDIYLMDLNKPTDSLINLTQKFNLKQFRPHGISFIKLGNGLKFLFVISHADAKHEVLKFEILGDSLKLENKYSSTDFLSPNDILAVGENQFYLTNDHKLKPGILRSLADFGRIANGNVVYYDGERAKPVSESIAYPNGINISADHRYIFVASTLDRKVYTYAPDPETFKLNLLGESPTSYGPDNIEIDFDGNLWVGCHPKMLDFLKHAKNEKALSPSAVVKMDFTPAASPMLSENLVYINKGEEISGSSVAAPYHLNTKFLVGSVFESKVLRINMILSEKK
jgi:arylesterase / paraoxonase